MKTFAPFLAEMLAAPDRVHFSEPLGVLVCELGLAIPHLLIQVL